MLELLKMKLLLVYYLCSCTHITILASTTEIEGMSSSKYSITNEWDSQPITHHAPVEISLSWKDNEDFLTATFQGPFFNDPPAPSGEPGKPFPQLWDYEVAEIFFLDSSTEHYLEVEVCPHGQHLVLTLDGTRKMKEDKLPMVYSATIDDITKTWRGVAQIPLSYIPRGIDKMNAYAIHGSGGKRVYEALYPVPTGTYQQPDFHRLAYFQPFNLTNLVKDTKNVGTYWDSKAN